MLVDNAQTTMTNTPSPPQTGIEKAIEKAGTQSKLAALIGTDQQMVSYWKKKGVVSDTSKCALIEQVTGVRCEELNPGENWAALRLVLCAPDRAPYESSDDAQPPTGGTVDDAKLMKVVAAH